MHSFIFIVFWYCVCLGAKRKKKNGALNVHRFLVSKIIQRKFLLRTLLELP